MPFGDQTYKTETLFFFFISKICHLNSDIISHQSWLLMASPYPGVSTTVRRSFTPRSSISTVDASIWTVLSIFSVRRNMQYSNNSIQGCTTVELHNISKMYHHCKNKRMWHTYLFILPSVVFLCLLQVILPLQHSTHLSHVFLISCSPILQFYYVFLHWQEVYNNFIGCMFYLQLQGWFSQGKGQWGKGC